MHKRSILCVFLAVWMLSKIAVASPIANSVLTGTVNIVLANANGMVVLTDSNQTVKGTTGEPSTSPLPGQKLFRVDDETVCTIAGFGAKYVRAYPELTTSAAEVLDLYSRELRRDKQAHSFREKLTSLYFLFEELLTEVGNLQHLDQAQVGDYEFELILAGYDTDGSLKIGKLVFDTGLSAEGVFRPVIKQLNEKTVGTELVYEKAGIGGFTVANILEYPAQLADEPEIGRYEKSKAADHGSSLTIADMEALAKSLARHSALVNAVYVGGFQKIWPVGGRNQVAILERGSIKSVDQSNVLLEPSRQAKARFSIVVGFHGSGRSLVTNNGRKIVLFVKSSFGDGQVSLDGVYYFENEFS
jgi:hypothetical protein